MASRVQPRRTRLRAGCPSAAMGPSGDAGEGGLTERVRASERQYSGRFRRHAKCQSPPGLQWWGMAPGRRLAAGKGWLAWDGQVAGVDRGNFVFHTSIERPNASIRQASSSPGAWTDTIQRDATREVP